MKKLLVLVSFAMGCVVIGGGLYARLAGGTPAATVSYYGDGSPKSSVTFEDGVKNGPCTQWFADGTIEAEGRYRDGFRDGAWRFWREDGSADTERSGLYEHGQRTAGL